MSYNPVKIKIDTSDKTLLNDLLFENIPGVEIKQRYPTFDSLSLPPDMQPIVMFIITVYSPEAILQLSKWFFSRIKSTKKTDE